MNAPAEWGDQYVWIALDSVTKMVLGFHVGKREAVSADAFMRDLSERIDGRFQLTTDGLRWYVPAVEEHFAGRADYAMLHVLVQLLPSASNVYAARPLWRRESRITFGPSKNS